MNTVLIVTTVVKAFMWQDEVLTKSYHTRLVVNMKSKLPHQRIVLKQRCFNSANKIIDIFSVQTISPSSFNRKQFTVSGNIMKENVCAEIMWALEVLNCNYFLSSCASKGKLFSVMFPDSDIAKNFN